MRGDDIEAQLMQGDQQGGRIRPARDGDQHAVRCSEEAGLQDALEKWFG